MDGSQVETNRPTPWRVQSVVGLLGQGKPVRIDPQLSRTVASEEGFSLPGPRIWTGLHLSLVKQDCCSSTLVCKGLRS